MRLIYFDEAGVGSEKDEPICVVTGVIVDGDMQWREIEADVDAIVARLVPEQDREGFEFRAKSLFSRDKSLTKGKWTRTQREDTLTAFLELIPKHELTVVSAAVDRSGWQKDLGVKQSHLPRKDAIQAQDFAFISCLNTANLWFQVAAPNEVGICIADNTDRWQWMKDLVKHYRKHTHGQPHEDELTLNRIIDSVYFADSHDSLGLQLADSCAFFLKRHLMRAENSEKFYAIIKHRILFKEIAFAESEVQEQ